MAAKRNARQRDLLAEKRKDPEYRNWENRRNMFRMRIRRQKQREIDNERAHACWKPE